MPDRSIYNLWQQVLDYFDAFLIGLTATPDKRTFGFFNENIVSEYSHERAVADGVNVGYTVYLIETEITKNGAELKAREFVDKREKLSRRKRWELLEEDVIYTPSQLDRDVVNPSQIRNIEIRHRAHLQGIERPALHALLPEIQPEYGAHKTLRESRKHQHQEKAETSSALSEISVHPPMPEVFLSDMPKMWALM